MSSGGAWIDTVAWGTIIKMVTRVDQALKIKDWTQNLQSRQLLYVIFWVKNESVFLKMI